MHYISPEHSTICSHALAMLIRVWSQHTEIAQIVNSFAQCSLHRLWQNCARMALVGTSWYFCSVHSRAFHCSLKLALQHLVGIGGDQNAEEDVPCRVVLW
jgi:hypothetical protein